MGGCERCFRMSSMSDAIIRVARRGAQADCSVESARDHRSRPLREGAGWLTARPCIDDGLNVAIQRAGRVHVDVVDAEFAGGFVVLPRLADPSITARAFAPL